MLLNDKNVKPFKKNTKKYKNNMKHSLECCIIHKMKVQLQITI